MSGTFLFWLIAVPAWSAPSVEQIFVHRLVKAHRSMDVERTRRIFTRWQILRLSCERQVTRDDIPTSCYARIKIEQSWGLAEAKAQLEDLDDRCRRATQARRSPAPMADLQALSGSCRDHILNGKKIDAYRRHEVRSWSMN